MSYPPKSNPPRVPPNPAKYATPEQVQAALDRAKSVLAKHQAELQQGAQPSAPTDPMILRIRKLARLAHARGIDRAQWASQREFARQERQDRAIAEFRAWQPPDGSWRM